MDEPEIVEPIDNDAEMMKAIRRWTSIGFSSIWDDPNEDEAWKDL